jgi:hypothetical protein
LATKEPDDLPGKATDQTCQEKTNRDSDKLREGIDRAVPVMDATTEPISNEQPAPPAVPIITNGVKLSPTNARVTNWPISHAVGIAKRMAPIGRPGESSEALFIAGH